MPILQTPDSLINSTITGNQTAPSVQVLADGSTVYAWANGLDIVGRVVSASGVIGGEFLVAAVAASSAARTPVITATNDGGFFVAWESEATGGDSSVLGRYFDALGANGSAQVTLENAALNDQVKPAVTTLSNGYVVVSWETTNGATTTVHAQILNGVTPVGTNLTITTSALAGIDKISSIASIADGRFLVTWESAGDIVGRIYNSAGTAEGAEFPINTIVANAQTDAYSLGLANGGFVVAWESSNGANTEIHARIADADGVPGAEFTVKAVAGVNLQDVMVTQLADGRLVFVYTDNSGGNADVYAQVTTAAGVAVNAAFRVNTTTALTQGIASVDALIDGRFVVTYESLEGGTTDIRTTIMDPTKFYGTSGVDTWSGGEQADTIYGYDGGDTLKGFGGADLIMGGLGVDTVEGGTGNDTIYGDAGNDILKGEDGDDRIYGGDGDDDLHAGSGNNTLYGGAGLDDFLVGSGNDTVSYYNEAAVTVILSPTGATTMGGAATGDRVLGALDNVSGSSTGNDTISGNATSNILYGWGGNDALTGGGGTDTLYGGYGNDTLNGGLDNDKLYGNAGNDILNGDDGNDAFYGGAGSDTMNGGVGTGDYVSYYSEVVGARGSFDGTVTAAQSALGDTFTLIESFSGSNTGDDYFAGDNGINVMSGNGGSDTFFARNGNDTLNGNDGDDFLYGGGDVDTINGGTGADYMQGGLGADKFADELGDDTYYYAQITEGGDIHARLGVVAGNNDTIAFKQSVFTGDGVGLNLGVLNTAKFKSRADNVAQDTDDHFIFNTATKTLWYDADGLGGTGPVLMIDFTNISTTMSYTDIEIVV